MDRWMDGFVHTLGSSDPLLVALVLLDVDRTTPLVEACAADRPLVGSMGLSDVHHQEGCALAPPVKQAPQQ